MNPKKILVVDDEQDIVDLLSYTLRKEGYEVTGVTDSGRALGIAEQIDPDLVILDVMMPQPDGYEVCEQLRNSAVSHAPIMFLTARSGENDQVRGLMLGADDYILKPVSPRVLLARVQSLIRRNVERTRTESVAAPEILRVEGLTLNRQNYTVEVDNDQKFFPKKEFELLAFLVANRGRTFSRDTLLQRIWGESILVVERTVDVHVSKIRDKIGPYGSLLETVKGVGYRFSSD